MLSGGGDVPEVRRGIPLHYLKDEFHTEREDIAKAVRLPTRITGALAEELGVHLSDGHMNDDGLVSFTGHVNDDRAYLYCRVAKLLKKVWGIRRVIKKEVTNECEGKSWVELRIYSRKLVKFKERVLGLPIGRKDELKMPSAIINHRRLLRRVLCGLFDGDGSLSFKSKWGLRHTYPVISFCTGSQMLATQVHKALRKLGFTVPVMTRRRDTGVLTIQMNGNINYERWMNTIGFNNPKHLTKVILYEQFGLVPPETDLEERLRILRGEVELSEIYPMRRLRVNKRRKQEKKLLEKLSKGENYVELLANLRTKNDDRIKRAFRRLSKMGLVKYVEDAHRCKSCRLTRWGVNKVQRVESIIKRLRKEYNLTL